MAKTFLNKKNNAKSTITDNPLTSGSTTLNVQTGDGAKFPNAPFHATLYSSDPANGEIVKVTAKSTDQFTIERAKENTTAQEWAQGTKLELLMTAQLLNDFQTRTEIVVATDGSGDYNCDGTSDEDEINEAISNLPSSGGIVRLKQGTYTIDGIIEILKNSVTLEGEGPATVIKAGNASELNRLISIGNGGTTAYSDICIRKLKVDGNRDNQTSGNSSPIVIWGASGYEHKRITVENCWLTGAYLDCLKILESQECIIKGNHFYDNNGTAIFNNSDGNTIIDNTSSGNGYFYYGSADNYTTLTGNLSMGDGYGFYLSNGWRDVITGNMVYNPSTSGVYLLACQRVAVTGNHFYSGSYGIVVGNNSSITQYNSITGNTFAWQGYRSIWLHSGSSGCINNVVSSNAIYGSQQHGIRLYGAQYNTITNNTIDYASRSSNNSYDSILLESNGSVYSIYNIIANNNCQATQSNKARYHIRENSSNENYNLISGNICKDAATSNIYTQGANTKIEDNIGYENSAVRVYRTSTNQNITTEEEVKVQFNAENYDTQNEFDPNTNYRFTAKKSGYYQVTAQVRWSGADDQLGHSLFIKKNGSEVTGNELKASGTSFFHQSISDIIYLSSGDYIEVFVFHESAADKTLGMGSFNTFLAIHKFS